MSATHCPGCEEPWALDGDCRCLHCWSNDGIICPFCGAEQSDIFEAQAAYEEGEHEYGCGSCGEDFKVETEVTFSYSTKVPEDRRDAQEHQSCAKDGGS